MMSNSSHTDAARSGRPVPQLLHAQEVADLLQVTTAWVYAETRRGRLPHVRLGRYVRFRRESIETWLADNERGLDTLPA